LSPPVQSLISHLHPYPSTPDSQSQLITFVKTLDTKLIERLPASHSKPGPNPRRPTETKALVTPYTITLPNFHPLEPQDLIISQVQRINDGSFSKFQEKIYISERKPLRRDWQLYPLPNMFTSKSDASPCQSLDSSGKSNWTSHLCSCPVMPLLSVLLTKKT